MTDPSLGPDDSLSAGELAAAVGAVRRDWRPVDAEPMPGAATTSTPLPSATATGLSAGSS
ncbi:hypothetical protein ACFQL4_00615 [Halosimplex aquaticum]